jgi:hypothetical protein
VIFSGLNAFATLPASLTIGPPSLRAGSPAAAGDVNDLAGSSN